MCKSATDHAAHCSIGRAKKAGKAPKIEIKKGNEEQKIKQIFQSNGAAAAADKNEGSSDKQYRRTWLTVNRAEPADYKMWRGR